MQFFVRKVQENMTFFFLNYIKLQLLLREVTNISTVKGADSAVDFFGDRSRFVGAFLERRCCIGFYNLIRFGK